MKGSPSCLVILVFHVYSPVFGPGLIEGVTARSPDASTDLTIPRSSDRASLKAPASSANMVDRRPIPRSSDRASLKVGGARGVVWLLCVYSPVFGPGLIEGRAVVMQADRSLDYSPVFGPGLIEGWLLVSTSAAK